MTGDIARGAPHRNVDHQMAVPHRVTGAPAIQFGNRRAEAQGLLHARQHRRQALVDHQHHDDFVGEGVRVHGLHEDVLARIEAVADPRHALQRSRMRRIPGIVLRRVREPPAAAVVSGR